MSDITSPAPSAAPAPSTSADSVRLSPAVEPRPRIWPGALIIVLFWIARVVPDVLAPGEMINFYTAFMGPMVATAAVLLWWLFASRISWRDRGLGLLAFVGFGAIAVTLAYDSSLVAPPLALIVYVLPVVATAWVAWLVVTPSVRWPVRRAGMVIVLLLAWASFASLRYDGAWGDFAATPRFRWTPTGEDQFLADLAAGKIKSGASADAASKIQPGDWPGFRGPDRDGRRPGVRIASDWEQHPPKLLWRHRVGPGWGSFAVVGNRLYTQEQRGAEEAVVCYAADSGAQLWAHVDKARFEERVGGDGPRATPTFHEGKIYAMGAAGRLNCLDAASGRKLWSRDILADSGAKLPTWGFAASPLVAKGVVTIFTGAPNGSVLAYDAASGEPAWSAGEGEFSYCSPQLSRVHGVEQLLITTDAGLTAIDPAKGKVLWQHSWPLEGGMSRVTQPALIGDADFLISTGFNMGTRRVRVDRKGDDWTTRDLWTTRSFWPYFNDMVMHQGHIFGFSNSVFCCLNLENGKEKWRARGYGSGQVLLLPDQDLLLVLSEKGEAALLEASPTAHKRLAQFQAIEGKTWNHPVIAHGKLFVRNGEEAACYELAPQAQDSARR